MPDMRNPDDWTEDELFPVRFTLLAPIFPNSDVIEVVPHASKGDYLVHDGEMMIVSEANGRKAHVIRATGWTPGTDGPPISHHAGSVFQLIGMRFIA